MMIKFISIICVLVLALCAGAKTLDEPTRLRRVKRNSGDVIIQRIPAIEQKRNYCLPASVEMILRYYGAKVNQRELGKIFNSSRKIGTSNNIGKHFGSGELEDFKYTTLYALSQQEYQRMVEVYQQALPTAARKRFLKQLQKDKPAFDLMDLRRCPEELNDIRQPAAKAMRQACKTYIDQGYPLLWSVAMGLDTNDRDTGFHARIIAGYQEKDGVITEIIYLDSWYGRRKFKRMPFTAAVLQTTKIAVIEPLSK